MTDTTSPESPWAKVLVGLIPSLNTCLTAIVSACIAGVAALWHAGWFAPPPPPRVVEVVKTVPDAGSIVQRLDAIEAALKALAEQKAVKGKRKTSTAAK